MNGFQLEKEVLGVAKHLNHTVYLTGSQVVISSWDKQYGVDLIWDHPVSGNWVCIGITQNTCTDKPICDGSKFQDLLGNVDKDEWDLYPTYFELVVSKEIDFFEIRDALKKGFLLITQYVKRSNKPKLVIVHVDKDWAWAEDRSSTLD